MNERNEFVHQTCDDPLSALAEFLERECFEEEMPDRSDERYILLHIYEEDLSVLRATNLSREDSTGEREIPVIRIRIERDRPVAPVGKEMRRCCAAASAPRAWRQRRNRLAHPML